MESVFFMSLLVAFSGLTVGWVRDYIFFRKSLTWWEAQDFCRYYYADLATVTTPEENQMLIETAGSNFTKSWIGLHWDMGSWRWSDRNMSSFRPWDVGQPYYLWDCVNVKSGGWNVNDCSDRLPFFCYRTLVLVKENKTWEEALGYCRTHYTDLGRLSSQTQRRLAKVETQLAQTASVWTGLRFLDGKWMWVSTKILSSQVSMPSCPENPYRCGARNTKQDLWENRDCGEKLNFLCYFD